MVYVNQNSCHIILKSEEENPFKTKKGKGKRTQKKKNRKNMYNISLSLI